MNQWLKVLMIALIAVLCSCDRSKQITVVEKSCYDYFLDDHKKDYQKPVSRVFNINDTLVLKFDKYFSSISICKESFNTRQIVDNDTLWQRITLRGKKGSYCVISDEEGVYFTSYGIYVNTMGSVIRLAHWLDNQNQLSNIKHGSKKVLMGCMNDFDFTTWDVKYKIESEYVSDTLALLPNNFDEFGFTERDISDTSHYNGINGDVTYHLLSSWLIAEQSYLMKKEYKPNLKRVGKYIQLSTDTTVYGLLKRPYRPLLLQTLQMYQSYALPDSLSKKINFSIQLLQK